MSTFTRRPIVGAGNIAPAPIDPAYLVFSGGAWTYAPPPAGGILNNFGAVTNPTPTDDTGAGYVVGSQWINTATNSAFLCVDNTGGAAVWIPLAGTGATANVEVIRISFAFDSASPLVIGALNPGDLITKSEVEIITPFDDPSASLAVGVTGAPTALQDASANDPAVVGNYVSEGNLAIGAGTNATLTIDPGISTTGTGIVLVTVVRA